MLTRERRSLVPPPTLPAFGRIDLPAPAALPSLPTALSRRRALFGAVTVAAVSATAMPAAASILSSEKTLRGAPKSGETPTDVDRRLAAMASDICTTLDGAAYAFDEVCDEDDQDRRLGHANALTLDMVALPAVGPPGVLAKAKAYLDSNSYDVLHLSDLADSLAEDIERVLGASS